MSDHIPDLTKMIGETPRTDAAWKPDGGDGYPTVDVDLARQLERELNAANERIKRLEEELERTKQDRNAIAKTTREPLLLKLDLAADRIKRLEEMYEGEIGENEQFLGSNLQGLLIRELNWSKERIKRLEEALESIQENWNRDNNERAMEDACWHAINTASEALEAKEAKP